MNKQRCECFRDGDLVETLSHCTFCAQCICFAQCSAVMVGMRRDLTETESKRNRNKKKNIPCLWYLKGTHDCFLFSQRTRGGQMS